MLAKSLLIACSVLSVLAAPSALLSKRFEDHAVHEERSSIPPGWMRSNILDKNRIIPVRINLVQNNLGEKAEGLLMSVSHPESSKYGEHYNPHEVADLFAPKKETVDIVIEWLREAGLDVHRSKHYDHWKGAVIVEMPIYKAEELLKATYHAYQHSSSGTPHVACTKYSVPREVQPHVDFILPSVHFDVPTSREPSVIRYPNDAQKRDGPKAGDFRGIRPLDPSGNGTLPSESKAQGALDQCDKQITLACLQALYGIKYTTKASAKNSYGIVEYTPQSYTGQDLDLFFNIYKKPLVGKRPVLKSISGGVLTGTNFDVNVESNLDLEYAMGLVYPLDVTLYQVGDKVIGGSFNTFLDALDASYCSGDDPRFDPQYPDHADGGFNGPKSCGTYKPAKVISTSYGYNEVDLTPAYEQRQCNEYLKLGLLGVTIVYSSGDYGVAGNGGDCLDPHTNKLDPKGIKFNPGFPSACPWITSIGATQVSPGKSVYQKEEAAGQVIFSGGGFSNNFAIPAYQKSAVSYWWAHYAPKYSSDQVNTSRKTRGFPDISANGVNYVVAVGGAFHLVYGTSASAPVVGSIFTLINDARLARGKKSIGFVNPTLYANPRAFNDIVTGKNPGCGTPGFSATKAWDPVTGLGTPRFDDLLNVFLKLQ